MPYVRSSFTDWSSRSRCVGILVWSGQQGRRSGKQIAIGQCGDDSGFTMSGPGDVGRNIHSVSMGSGHGWRECRQCCIQTTAAISTVTAIRHYMPVQLTMQLPLHCSSRPRCLVTAIKATNNALPCLAFCLLLTPRLILLPLLVQSHYHHRLTPDIFRQVSGATARPFPALPRSPHPKPLSRLSCRPHDCLASGLRRRRRRGGRRLATAAAAVSSPRRAASPPSRRRRRRVRRPMGVTACGGGGGTPIYHYWLHRVCLG